MIDEHVAMLGRFEDHYSDGAIIHDYYGRSFRVAHSNNYCMICEMTKQLAQLFEAIINPAINLDGEKCGTIGLHLESHI